jgi:hypothetical protein
VASIGAAPAAPVKLKRLGRSRCDDRPQEGLVPSLDAESRPLHDRLIDRSSEHNFRLRGPVSRMITSISATGTKTVTVTLTLKPGRYTYVCDPHADMIGSFRVK